VSLILLFVISKDSIKELKSRVQKKVVAISLLKEQNQSSIKLF